MRGKNLRYVIVYDITNDKRRNKVARVLEGHGERVQYSVFECQLKKKQFVTLWKALEELVQTEADSLRAYGLCASCAQRIRMIGQAKEIEQIPEVYVV